MVAMYSTMLTKAPTVSATAERVPGRNASSVDAGVEGAAHATEPCTTDLVHREQPGSAVDAMNTAIHTSVPLHTPVLPPMLHASVPVPPHNTSALPPTHPTSIPFDTPALLTSGSNSSAVVSIPPAVGSAVPSNGLTTAPVGLGPETASPSADLVQVSGGKKPFEKPPMTAFLAVFGFLLIR
jgi:hypothetical protein